MFTGLIEDVGQVAARARRDQGLVRLTLRAALFDEEMPLGASLAVDGVCLTVVAWRPGAAEVEAGPETLARTTLGDLQPGRRINLERAMRLSDRLGGHLVAGHVDAVGAVLCAGPRGDAWDLRVGLPPPLRRYVVDKGSIAVDGTSLTVNQVDDEGFAVSLIPHTQQRTTLVQKQVGQMVNLEVDIIGKYVERLLGAYLPSAGDRPGLTLDKLKEHGFAAPE